MGAVIQKLDAPISDERVANDLLTLATLQQTPRILHQDRWGKRGMQGASIPSPARTAITLDVYLAALAFSLGVAADQGAGRARWWAVAATFGIGLAVSLPGYLWWRSRPTGRDASTP